MKTKNLIATLVVVFCLGISLSASAAVPGTMTYHGNLTESSGEPVDTTVEATFRLYDALSEGNEVWSETFSTIDVVDGSFTAQLGATQSLVDVFDGSPYWIEVTIDGESLSPRNPVESVPYALRSNKANDADSLQGLSAADVQAALDELALLQSRIESLEASLQNDNGDIVDVASLEERIDQNETSIANFAGALDDLGADIEMNTSKINTNSGRVGLNDELIDTNITNISANATAINSLQTDVANNANALDDLADDISTNATAISTNQTDITAIQNLTQDMDRTTINGHPAIAFTGVNVHVRNGLDATDGDTGSGPQVNGLGNLVVGYDEEQIIFSDKSGSHNLVLGTQNNYSSYGGLVAGQNNLISGTFASVIGGGFNVASGSRSSIGGGTHNIASGVNSRVSGGSGNTADASHSTVSGGRSNTASGDRSTVSGGQNRSVNDENNWRAGSLFESN